MDIISYLIDIFLHLDEYLATVISNYGVLTYALLFLIIFMETAFVVTPFLPGDSLLFAAGTFASPALGEALNIWILIPLLILAAVLGDTVNYWIGHYIGPKAFSGDIRFLKKEYLDRTHDFYDRHGGKTAEEFWGEIDWEQLQKEQEALALFLIGFLLEQQCYKLLKF